MTTGSDKKVKPSKQIGSLFKGLRAVGLPKGDGSTDTTFGTAGIASGADTGIGLAMAVDSAGDTILIGTPTSGTGLLLQAFNTESAPVRLYVEQDANYNTVSLTDTAGQVVERYVYDPYGAVTVLKPDGTVRGDGSAAASYYGFVNLRQGTRLDVVTGTYENRNRVYSVSLGRWLQKDPAGYVDGSNPYIFECSNSISSSDSFGLDTNTINPVQSLINGFKTGNIPYTPSYDVSTSGLRASSMYDFSSKTVAVHGSVKDAVTPYGLLNVTSDASFSPRGTTIDTQIDLNGGNYALSLFNKFDNDDDSGHGTLEVFNDKKDATIDFYALWRNSTFDLSGVAKCKVKDGDNSLNLSLSGQVDNKIFSLAGCGSYENKQGTSFNSNFNYLQKSGLQFSESIVQQDQYKLKDGEIDPDRKIFYGAQVSGSPNNIQVGGLFGIHFPLFDLNVQLNSPNLAKGTGGPPSTIGQFGIVIGKH